jgi:hypothetical protein
MTSLVDQLKSGDFLGVIEACHSVISQMNGGQLSFSPNERTDNGLTLISYFHLEWNDRIQKFLVCQPFDPIGPKGPLSAQ